MQSRDKRVYQWKHTSTLCSIVRGKYTHCVQTVTVLLPFVSFILAFPSSSFSHSLCPSFSLFFHLSFFLFLPPSFFLIPYFLFPFPLLSSFSLFLLPFPLFFFSFAPSNFPRTWPPSRRPGLWLCIYGVNCDLWLIRAPFALFKSPPPKLIKNETVQKRFVFCFLVSHDLMLFDVRCHQLMG